MCFYAKQVLELFEEFPEVGELVLQHMLPCSRYLGPNPPTGIHALAHDIANMAGTVFEYGPEDFSKETFLRVLEYLTVPIKVYNKGNASTEQTLPNHAYNKIVQTVAANVSLYQTL